MLSVHVDPVINEQELARFLGAEDNLSCSFSTTSKIEKWFKTIEAVMKPSVYYCVKTIESIGWDSVQLEGNIQLKSRNLSKTLRLCDEAVCFIATIGHRIEKVISRCMSRHHYSDAYIVDAMGSVGIENLVEQFHQRLALRYHARGEGVTLRFSPGYCDWNLTDQKKIFGLFDPDQIDVDILGSCFIVPRKSIVGLFGICPEHNGISQCSYNPCNECSRLDCAMRRGEDLS
jgi:hypothetical protein